MKKKKSRELKLLYFNIYYKTTEIKKVAFTEKIAIEQNRVQKKAKNYD